MKPPDTVLSGGLAVSVKLIEATSTFDTLQIVTCQQKAGQAELRSPVAVGPKTPQVLPGRKQATCLVIEMPGKHCSGCVQVPLAVTGVCLHTSLALTLAKSVKLHAPPSVATDVGLLPVTVQV